MVQQQFYCFRLPFVIMCRMAMLVLFHLTRSRCFLPQIAILFVPLSSTVLYRTYGLDLLSYIDGNCGRARRQGGYRPAAAMPPLYTWYIYLIIPSRPIGLYSILHILPLWYHCCWCVVPCICVDVLKYISSTRQVLPGMYVRQHKSSTRYPVSSSAAEYHAHVEVGFVFAGYFAVLSVLSCVHGFFTVSLTFVRVGRDLVGFANLFCFFRGSSCFGEFPWIFAFIRGYYVFRGFRRGFISLLLYRVRWIFDACSEIYSIG